MRLSQAVSPAEPLTVPFAGGVELHITYRPMSYTPAELDRLSAETAKKGETGTRLVQSMRQMLESWDLTDDDDVPIPLTEVGPDERDPLLDIPSNVYMAIMRKINEAQQAGEA